MEFSKLLKCVGIQLLQNLGNFQLSFIFGSVPFSLVDFFSVQIVCFVLAVVGRSSDFRTLFEVLHCG